MFYLVDTRKLITDPSKYKGNNLNKTRKKNNKNNKNNKDVKN